MAAQFFGRAFLFLAGPLLGCALLLYELSGGAFALQLDGAPALGDALALGRALQLDGTLAFLSGETFLLLAGPLLLSPFLGGAFLLEPGLFLGGVFLLGAFLGGAFLLEPGALFGGAFLFLAGAFLGGAFLFLAGGSLLLRGELAIGDAGLPGGALMLRTALLARPGGGPLLVGQVWLYRAVRRCGVSRLWADVVDFWAGNGP